MKKANFPMIADILFYTVCAFALGFCVMRFYRLPLWLCFSVAPLIAAAVGGIAFLSLYRTNHKRALSKHETESKDALMLHLALEKPERVRAALLEAYLADGKDAHCGEEELMVNHLPVVPLFSLDPVSADEIARLIRNFGQTRFLVVCNSLSPQAQKLAASFGIEIKTAEDVYALFSKTGKTPNPLICGEIPRRSIKQKLHRAFSKSNARPFLTCGLLLLFMSLFVYFPVYYLVSGVALLSTAVIVRLLGYQS